MRFIATADWQLGMPAHFLQPEARHRYLQDRFEVIERIGELAERTEAAFVVVAGDVFESNQLDRRIISRTFEALSGFTVPVAFLPGNHDPLDRASIYDDPQFTSAVPSGVYVIRDGAPWTPIDGVEVVGAPWASKRPGRDLVAQLTSTLEAVGPGVVRVLVGHGAVSSMDPDRDNPATIAVEPLSAAITDSRIQVAILGDHHSAHEVAPGVWYPGTPEVTARREVNPGKVLLVEVDDDTSVVNVESHQVGRWVFTTAEAELHERQDVDHLIAHLGELPNKSRTAVWLILRGALNATDHEVLQSELGRLSDVFARLDLWQRHTDLVTLPDSADFVDLPLTGFTRDTLAELVDMAGGGGPQAETAGRSLQLLYRFTHSLVPPDAADRPAPHGVAGQGTLPTGNTVTAEATP